MSSKENDDFDLDSSSSDEASATQSPLDKLFEHATQAVRMRTGEMDKSDLLYLYGRFKYAHEGPCKAPKPGMFNFEAKAKWESWNGLGSRVSRDQCKQEYIDRLDKCLRNWRNGFSSDGTAKAKSDNKGTFGIRMSVMAAETGNSEEQHQPRTCFDYCKEGDLDKLKQSFNRDDVDRADDNGMTMLMWACDRGRLDVVKYLTESCGADLNKQDQDGQSCLHYAVACEHVDIVKFLSSLKGLDRQLEDNDGQKPIDLTDNKEIIQVLS